MSEALDPVTIQVLQERLITIVREMRTTMIRASFSSAINELYDLSCALLNHRGELVVQSEDNPQHIFPLLWTAGRLLEKYGDDIEPGDLFIHNDPYEGGTHLNDIALITPYFYKSGLLFFPVVRAHWEDVGGAARGSISGMAHEIFQEGVRIPLVRLARAGETGEDLLRLLYANMRTEHEREGDFRAMEGTCAIARERLDSVLDRYGSVQTKAYVDELLDREEQRMQAHLSRLKEGEYRYEGYLDPRPDLSEILRIRTRVSIQNGELSLDFTGSSKQMRGPYNIGPSGAPTGVFMMVKSLVDPEGPVNSGSFRPIHVYAPPGTFINAVYPAAVGGMGDVRRTLESVVMAALAPVLPQSITGDTKGTANQILIGGTHPYTGRAFLLYEAPAGGTGGFAHGDGNNTLRTFNEGDFTAIQPIEAIEQKFPVLVEECSLRVDSGGAGYWRGGLGMRRVVQVQAFGVQLSIVSDKNVLPPYGLFGAAAGAPNAFWVEREGERIDPSPIPGKVANFPLQLGDRLVINSSGGGGYGDPLARSPMAVAADVLGEYVSAAIARTAYGVVLTAGGVDWIGTAGLRQSLGADRVIVIVHPAVLEEDPRYPPVCWVHSATASRIQVNSGDVAELLDAQKPTVPCRVTVYVGENVREGEAMMKQETLDWFGWSQGACLWLRCLTTHNVQGR